ncbi:MAG: rod shape-determining protein MreD [Vallitaleaceae bacterium]|jgi:rod shape-determining protein MreD|nr:rod shape-determining protein MreD [Vallitaleaceae bacterium]
MLRTIAITLIIILNVSLQSTFVQAISIYNIVFNLFIITIVSFALLRGQKEGLIIGFALGILHDVFFGEFIGLYALLYMYIGFINGMFSKSFFKESLFFPIIAIALSDLGANLIIYITFLFRGRTQFFLYFITTILPEVSYTTLVSIGIYRFYLFINNKLEYYDRWKGSRNKL